MELPNLVTPEIKAENERIMDHYAYKSGDPNGFAMAFAFLSIEFLNNEQVKDISQRALMTTLDYNERHNGIQGYQQI